MTGRTIVVVLIAVIVAALGAAMLASSLTAGTSGEHTMPDGSSMQRDEMP